MLLIIGRVTHWWCYLFVGPSAHWFYKSWSSISVPLVPFRKCRSRFWWSSKVQLHFCIPLTFDMFAINQCPTMSQDGTVRAWDMRMGARSLFLCDPYAHEGFWTGEIGCIGGASVDTDIWKATQSGIRSETTREVLKREVGNCQRMLEKITCWMWHWLKHNIGCSILKTETPHDLFCVVGRIDLRPGEMVLKRKAPEDKPLTRGQDATTFRDYWWLLFIEVYNLKVLIAEVLIGVFVPISREPPWKFGRFHFSSLACTLGGVNTCEPYGQMGTECLIWTIYLQKLQFCFRHCPLVIEHEDEPTTPKTHF